MVSSIHFTPEKTSSQILIKRHMFSLKKNVLKNSQILHLSALFAHTPEVFSTSLPRWWLPRHVPCVRVIQGCPGSSAALHLLQHLLGVLKEIQNSSQSDLVIPSWRSLKPLKGSLNHPKKVTTLNHQVVNNCSWDLHGT